MDERLDRGAARLGQVQMPYLAIDPIPERACSLIHCALLDRIPHPFGKFGEPNLTLFADRRVRNRCRQRWV
jgi:hypothetical protein